MSVFLTSLILWLVITGFSYSELIVGIAVSLIVSLVFAGFTVSDSISNFP